MKRLYQILENAFEYSIIVTFAPSIFAHSDVVKVILSRNDFEKYYIISRKMFEDDEVMLSALAEFIERFKNYKHEEVSGND